VRGPVLGVNTTAREGYPVLTPDRLHIYFASNREGGSSKIFEARRASDTEPFRDVSAIAELEVAGGQSRPTWVSDDGCTLYFSSERGGNGMRLYRSMRK
jgi:hypothetical protein